MNFLKLIRNLFLIVLPSVSFNAFAQSNDVHNIGLIVALTGASSYYGQECSKGAQLAYEHLPEASRNKIKIFIEDDQFDGKLALSAYQNLKNKNKINTVILFGSQSGHSVIPLASEQDIFSMVFTVDRKVNQGKKNSFRLMMEAKSQVEVLRKYILSKGYKKIAILATIHEATLEYRDQLKEALIKENISIVYHQEFNKGEIDFRTSLLNIRKANPDLIVNDLLAPSMATFAKQKKQLLKDLPVIGFAQVENIPEIKSSQGALDDIVFTAAYINEEFKKTFKTKYNQEPGSFAGYGYEAINLISSALESGAKSSEDISKYIGNKKDFSGCFGSYSKAEDNSFNIPASLMTIKNGEILKVEKE